MSFISVFLTVNSFLLKLDVGKFIGGLCLVRSYHISAEGNYLLKSLAKLLKIH